MEFKLMSNVDDARAALAGLESKLQDALARRDAVIVETAHAADKAAAIGGIGDQSAKMSLSPLNKKAGAIDAEISLLRVNIVYAKRQLELATNQAAASARASSNAPVRDKLYEVVCPDGRKVRHRGASQEDVQRHLQKGYTIVGQVFGADDGGNGGFIPRPGFLTAMLEAYKGELIEFLETHGISGDPVKIILPANGREAV
jgi:hypothetical protein